MQKKLYKFFKVFIVLTFIVAIIFVIGTYTKYYKQEKEAEPNIYKEFRKTSNFKLENLNRYISYKKYHNNLSFEKIVTFVNIGLDYDFYHFTKKADLSYQNLVLVNKYNGLSSNYVPSDLEEINNDCFINGNPKAKYLRSEAKDAFEQLCLDSIKNGTPVYGQSGYRSYETQNNLYENAVKTYGEENASKDTARPGYSEHQTGLAIDVSSTKYGNMLSFEKTESFSWMLKNAHKYGFILRYSLDNEDTHGYIYEPWHYRYVGVKVATDMYVHHKDLTFDEYYYKYIEKKEV